jgi:hypothetical protein
MRFLLGLQVSQHYTTRVVARITPMYIQKVFAMANTKLSKNGNSQAVHIRVNRWNDGWFTVRIAATAAIWRLHQASPDEPAIAERRRCRHRRVDTTSRLALQNRSEWHHQLTHLAREP